MPSPYDLASREMKMGRQAGVTAPGHSHRLRFCRNDLSPAAVRPAGRNAVPGTGLQPHGGLHGLKSVFAIRAIRAIHGPGGLISHHDEEKGAARRRCWPERNGHGEEARVA